MHFKNFKITLNVFCIQNLSRAIANIAVGMIHSKELRDFFNDVVEKVSGGDNYCPCQMSLEMGL